MVVPFLIKHQAVKAFGGLEVQLRTFLTPALEEGGEVYALAAVSH
jgi:hypothetical protein